ncbi:restriction endonuclease subunit S [Bacteroides thetaiotaomicron]|uniref:restriction endonuclease subunit S n=1 Tax=Bacteroides thetaiotaomicron TaxID=818 RepID=UPI001CE365B4|nr:restriction endonuclease subunit S [Bacteroides thetaiotaomicron]MCA6032400.1 restriction endonuclease subunit S [Bacteroides thetaiotaomicron]
MEKNKKNVPKIRFKGFTEKWEEKEFSNTFLFLNNNTLSRAELNYESGSTKNVHYGDVLIKFGECLDISKEELPYITNEKIANKYAHLQDGDIIIADAAEDETVGKCTELLNVNEQVVAGLHTIACRPLLSFANRYLGYLLNASVFHNQLLPLMQGTKIVGISKSAIKDTLIYYPEFNEQTQIGNYFQNIDKLIEAKQSRIDKLKNIKKACLEKMFPKKGATTPEIRFKGFIGEWVLRQLDTMTSYSNGRGHEEKQSNQGKYELINLNSISIDGGLKPSGKFINEASDTLLKNDLVMVLSDVGHGDLLGRVAIYQKMIDSC